MTSVPLPPRPHRATHADAGSEGGKRPSDCSCDPCQVHGWPCRQWDPDCPVCSDDPEGGEGRPGLLAGLEHLESRLREAHQQGEFPGAASDLPHYADMAVVVGQAARYVRRLQEHDAPGGETAVAAAETLEFYHGDREGLSDETLTTLRGLRSTPEEGSP